jgi:membrane protease YdiL (CAAX protease family)
MTEKMLTPENLRFTSAVLWCVIGFGSYYFLSQNRRCSGRFANLSRFLEGQGNRVLFQRMLGFLFLGAVPAIIIVLWPQARLREFGLTLDFRSIPPWWSFLLVPAILIMGYFAAQKPGNLEHYPQIRAKIWTPVMVLISSASWLVFLVGYEFMFRGVLLYASLGLMDPLAAISLNCALYAFAHFYKGPVETFGAIPVGIILCYLTLITGNIWSAVVLHSLMALSNEWFSLRAHPEMKILRAG